MFRRLLNWRKFLFGESFATGGLLAALLFGYIVVISIVYRPIHEMVILRYFYTSEEIWRNNLRVVEFADKRHIVISNGERRSFDTGLTSICMGMASGLMLSWLAVGYWASARLNRRFSPTQPEDDAGRIRKPPDSSELSSRKYYQVNAREVATGFIRAPQRVDCHQAPTADQRTSEDG